MENQATQNYYASYAPDTKKKTASGVETKEKRVLSMMFGCCECSVVGCRISMLVFLIVMSCLLSIVFSSMDIANDGEDTSSFLFWFSVLVTLFFFCDTCLIAVLCVKGLPCIPSNTVLSYSLLPFYLIVQSVFVLFLFIQLIINFIQWAIQCHDDWRGRVPLWLDIVHIVTNTFLIFVFPCCLCIIGLVFSFFILFYVGKEGVKFVNTFRGEQDYEDGELAADSLETTMGAHSDSIPEMGTEDFGERGMEENQDDMDQMDFE